jgi:hypothetical protein
MAHQFLHHFSCTTLTSSPPALSSVEYVCRTVWRPTHFVIPARLLQVN